MLASSAPEQRDAEPLACGAECFWIVATKPTPSGRRTYKGAARVVVETVVDVGYRVRVVLSASFSAIVGVAYVVRRVDLFSTSEAGERLAFANAIGLYHRVDR